MQDKTYVLGNGIRVPRVGLGTWKLGEVESETVNLVREAIDLGYRHIDCAYIYGNEAAVGQAIEQSHIDREELFVSNKVWNTFRGYEKTIAACKASLKAMKLEYFDTYLIHWPASFYVYEDWKEQNNETWRGMQALYEQGYVRTIGVSNCKKHHIQAIKEKAQIIPMINQIEFHPGQMQLETFDYCKENSILIEAWSPLGTGLMLRNKKLKVVSQKYGVSVAKVCLAWCLMHNTVVLPRSSNPERMIENLMEDGFTLCSEDFEYINQLPYLGGSRMDPDETDIFEEEKHAQQN